MNSALRLHADEYRITLSAKGLLIPHPRIKISIENIGEQVAEDDERRADDEDGHEQGIVTFDGGLRVNVSVGVRYVDAWLQGNGAAAIDNLMEDAATAEISRSQVWSWVQAGRFDEARVREEVAKVDASEAARDVFLDVALSVPLKDFLTLEAYGRLP